MDSINFRSKNEIRLQFTQAMSGMYQLEVPLYKNLLSLAKSVNEEVRNNLPKLTVNETRLLNLEHHGAIRVGTTNELSKMRRLFAVMGMVPVDYYDLSLAGIPVHSTAFRALDREDLELSPFRVFCSLLRLDLIDNIQLRQQANEILERRQIFPAELLGLIDLSEKQGGLTPDDSDSFIKYALEVFRWHQNSTVEKQTYDELKAAHGLVADVVSFKGPHINHLTPKVLDIDACQNGFTKKQIKAKAFVEGPPKRTCPILLRQTSFIAIAEEITFSDGKNGSHTARFGEVEQRGIALTPKGRELYDRLLVQARNAGNNSEVAYEIRLSEAFEDFPDNYEDIRQQDLGYFCYSTDFTIQQLETKSSDIESLIKEGVIKATPIVYEDFLPVSAAGIFTSNLSSNQPYDVNQIDDLEASSLQKEDSNRNCFETALGMKVVNSFDLYESIQQNSLNATQKKLGFNF